MLIGEIESSSITYCITQQKNKLTQHQQVRPLWRALFITLMALLTLINPNFNLVKLHQIKNNVGINRS